MRATKEFKILELVGSGLAVEPFVTALDTSTHTGECHTLHSTPWPTPGASQLRTLRNIADRYSNVYIPPGRRALTSVLDSETFKWALVALGIVLGLFLLAAVIWAIVTKCGRVRSAPVVPGSSAAARVGRWARGGCYFQKGAVEGAGECW